jgi:glycosyltransferase involved in cell wall biosynthesis
VKVALIVPGGVDRSGVDRVIPCLLWLIERLARRHEVHVFALRQEPEPDAWNLLGARVHNIGTTGGWRRRLLARFATEHRRAPFQVVHAFFAGCGTYAAVIGWRHRVPVLVHPTGNELVALRDIGYGMRCTVRGRVGLRIAVAGARRVTVPTPYMQALAASQGIAAQRVPMGVALDRWPPAEPRARDSSRAARLLHVGDIRPVKDQTTLLAAASDLRDRGLDFELDLVGYDTMDGALQRSAAAQRLSTVTRWHGVLRRDALRALMEEATLLLVSSRHEAEPMVVLEAAIAGVPTVGTAVGHVADWAPAAAVAVPVGDAAALAAETAALLADEPRRLALAHAAQQRAITIDADYTTAAFERIYQELRNEGARWRRHRPRGLQ